MHTERLQMMSFLMHQLDGTPPQERVKRFDLSDWCSGDFVCAIGLAALHPWFQAIGLSLRTKDFGFATGLVPAFNGYEGYSAAAQLFDISRYQARQLFSPDRYKDEDCTNPLAVAHRIDALLHRQVALSA